METKVLDYKEAVLSRWDLARTSKGKITASDEYVNVYEAENSVLDDILSHSSHNHKVTFDFGKKEFSVGEVLDTLTYIESKGFKFIQYFDQQSNFYVVAEF